MTNKQNIEKMIPMKGVSVDTIDNNLATIIRNIDNVTSIKHGKGELMDGLGGSDGYLVEFNGEKGDTFMFVESFKNHVGIDGAYYVTEDEDELPLPEPTDNDVLLVSIAMEAALNKSSDLNFNLGEEITKINQVSLIDETNVADLNKIIQFIINMQDVDGKDELKPLHVTELVDPGVIPFRFNPDYSAKNLMEFILDGYAVSKELAEHVAEEETVDSEVCSAVAEKLPEVSEEETMDAVAQPVQLSLVPEPTPKEETVTNEDVSEKTTAVVASSSNVFKVGDEFDVMNLLSIKFDKGASQEDIEKAFPQATNKEITANDVAEVSDLIEIAVLSDFSLNEIATACGVSYSVIYKISDRNNVIENDVKSTKKSMSKIISGILPLLENKYGNGSVITLDEKTVALLEKVSPSITESVSTQADAPVVETVVDTAEQPVENTVVDTVEQFVEEKQVDNSSATTNKPADKPVIEVVQNTPIEKSQPVQIQTVQAQPARSVINNRVEFSSLLKTLTGLKAIEFMEKKVSKINRNVESILTSLNSVVKLNSPNSVLIENVYSAIADLQTKNEMFEETLFNIFLENAIELVTEWQELFVVQNPSFKPQIQKALSAYQNAKEDELNGHNFTLEELKELRPLAFDNEWVRNTLKIFDIKESIIEEVIQARTEKLNFVLEHDRDAIADIQASFDFVGTHESVLRSIDNVLLNLNIFVSGDAGTGKTTLIQSLSCLFNRPLYTVNGSKSTDKDSFLGEKTIEDRDIEVIDGALVRAMNIGGFFYLDEANGISPQVLLFLNSAADHRREVYNDLTGKKVFAKEGFLLFASYNPDYDGTQKLNAAFKSRGVGMKLPYMSTDELTSFLQKMNPELPKSHEIFGQARALYRILMNKSQGVEIPVEARSARWIITMVKKLASGRVPMEYVLNDLLQSLDEEEETIVFNAIATNPASLGIKIEGSTIISKYNNK